MKPTVKKLRIATRRSALAVWQAEFIREQLMRQSPDTEIELVTFTTRGDKILDTPLAKVGGKGLFVKELEQAILEGNADIAVHSMKDVPMEFPPGLHLPVICERETPTDAFVSNRFESLNALPVGASVGTSSLRRECQLASVRPDIKIVSLRGNVNTRLRKLDEGEFDAILLATSGLKRLGFDERISEQLDAKVMLPAGGQGALGIETRIDDPDVEALVATLNHKESETCVRAERAMNRRLDGGCQVPIGCYAQLIEGGSDGKNVLSIRGLVGSNDGQIILTAHVAGDPALAEKLGVELADNLLRQGAAKILQKVYSDERLQ